ALGVGSLFQFVNVGLCLHLPASRADSGGAHLDRLGNLKVRFLRLRLNQFGDEIATLLGGQMSAADVGADDKRDRVVTAEGRENRFNTGSEAGAVTVPAVEDLVLEYDDRLEQAALLDVGDERVELGALHQREDVGSGVIG